MFRTFGLLLSVVAMAATANAQDKSPAGQAHWLLERLTGVHWPKGNAVETQMAARISANDAMGAANLATNQKQFLNVTVKLMSLKLSTREETVRLRLNDFSAAFIGVTRDQSDARELLYGDFYYAYDPAKNLTNLNIPSVLAKDILASTAHYDAIDRLGLDVGDVLKRYEGQSIVTDPTLDVTIANPDPAGVLTQRTWMAAHAVAGTNRRLVEYAFREFMCLPLANWADTEAPDVRVGRDVDRFPGGDNAKYQTTCKGCHTQQDGFRGAFAKWDFSTNGGLATYATSGGIGRAAPAQTGGVMRKMNQNNTVYAGGYITTDDSWVNHATRGVNATTFGWRGLAPDGSGSSVAGRGVNAFGRLVANSQRFSQCMVQRVFDAVCKHELSATEAQTLYSTLGTSFEQNQYNLKKLFQLVAIHPKCRI